MTSPRLRRLQPEHVDDLLAGVALLGSGGGVVATPFGHLAREILSKSPVAVLRPDQLRAGALVAPVGIVGATALLTEKLPSGQEIIDGVDALSRWLGRRPTAVMGIEAGGVNGIIPILAAAALDLPLVDADLMGRAMPRLDQFSSAVQGLPITPCVVAQPGGEVMLLNGIKADRVESTIRAVVSRTSGWGQLVVAPMTPGQVTAAAVPGSLSRAIWLGHRFRRLAREYGTPGATYPAGGAPIGAKARAFGEQLGGRGLAGGRVAARLRRPSAGEFAQSDTVLVDVSGSVLRVSAENEFLAVFKDGVMVAGCPDLIVMVDNRSHALLQVEEVRVGTDVLVLTIPGPPWWLAHPQRLERVGPRAFGIDHDAVLVDAQ